MSRKRLCLAVLFLVLLIFIVICCLVKETPKNLFNQSEAMDIASQKTALIRLEDLNPGTYDNEDKWVKLMAIADYLHGEGVPFQVAVIPEYRDPKNNVVISIGDTGNPQVRGFIEAVKYMRDQGGVIGLHGYTHQFQTDATGSGYEFAGKGQSQYAQPAYAEDRIRKALTLMDKAGLPVEFWETPHYTATMPQYKVISSYFGLVYDPNPLDKDIKSISTWDSTGPDNLSTVFVPAPLLSVTGDKDVDRILNKLDKNDSLMLPSFFCHPFQEFKFMYKMQSPVGGSFYVHETNSYLHRLIGGFKERGYRFVSIYDVICFIPAQRVLDTFPAGSSVLMTGDFDGDGRSDILTGNTASGSWQVKNSGIDRALPRNNPQSIGKSASWLENWGQGAGRSYTVGDFNGDGKKDLAYRDSATGEVQVALSDSTKFIIQDRPWGGFKVAEDGKLFAGDFNGDAKDDLLFWNQGKNSAVVMISSGKKFASPETWLENWRQGSEQGGPLVGDFNGDGKKDLAFIDNDTGNVDAALSSGDKFMAPRDNCGKSWIKNFAPEGGWQVVAGDFSGAGMDSLAAYDRVNRRWRFALPEGNNFVVRNNCAAFVRDTEGNVLCGDFNGDHKMDMLVQRYLPENRVSLDIFLSVLGTNNSL